ncbi:response regulator [Desulfotalea psychrophila]|uniref:histidine kinase n=1 Tax=Desulfotalea psychrophila (strain LSv54 / DSM 12343) TaxID=177439 RepID=Q6AMA3_DESPS|nr:related to two-component system sensory/regulatory protein (hybrid family) [Desulfotalea psychrophila LSv54]
MHLSNVPIRLKLQFLFLLTGVLPLIIIGFLYSQWTETSLVQEATNKLLSIQDIHRDQIEDHFVNDLAAIQVFASSKDTYNTFTALKKYHSQPEGLATFSKKIQGITEHLANYTKRYNYEDIYLIDAEHGDVLFSLNTKAVVWKRLDSRQYKDTVLAKTWRKALGAEGTVITDFEPFFHDSSKQMAFIGYPVFGEDNHKIGVILIRFSADFISQIIESTRGMGETGESYIITPQDQTGKFELRSNLRTMGDGKFVVGYTFTKNLSYWADAEKAGLAGGHSMCSDSADTEVLVAYNLLEIDGLDWYLISKIDNHEITAPIRAIYKKFGLVVVVCIFFISIIAWLLSRNFTRPIIAEIEFANNISHGKLGERLEIERNDELGTLAASLNNMSEKLQKIDWMKSGRESLDNDLRGDLALDELSKRAIRFFVKHMNIAMGAIYLNDGHILELRSSYAFSDRKGNFSTFKFGEGLVGQAALENELLSFSNLVEDAPAINYGIGEEIPGYFVAAPLAIEGDIVGVILFASINRFTKIQRDFIEQSSANLAVILNAAQSRMRIATLLDQSQEQQRELASSNRALGSQARALKESETELQAQQEELRITNEELEEQTRALKQSEAELQAQQEELRVANEELQQRTGALEKQRKEISTKNIELLDAQKIVEGKVDELETSGKYKSEFLANMSHELRTPLNSILILSQLLSTNKAGNLSDKQVESAGAIHSSGAELLNLINDILDLSKVEAGKVELIIEEIPFKRIEADLHRLYKDLAHDKGISFDITLNPQLPQTLKTDSQRLQQVLRNLITNSFKFTLQGSVSLEIEPAPAEQLLNTRLEGQKAIVFAVKDDGIGIPQAQQQNIFEAFQQVDGSTSRKYGGTGLGLSISKELTKLLGGFITLSSVEDEGSTFRITLPLNNQAIATDTPEEKLETEDGEKQPARKEIKKTPPSKEETICPITNKASVDIEDDRGQINSDSKSLLIIEDDENFSRVLRDIGRDRGFACILASDGETGLALADHYTPSAIILDIGLPGIDGWTVMERLKDNSKLRHIPVHFMSASDSSMDAMRMGAIGYLTKPVSMEKVEETLAKLENVISRSVKRLLLVEDDKIQRESIIELIGNSDVKTTAVDSGAGAILELNRERYDCMILDLGLGDMSGFELLEKIRQSESLYRLPIIIYTGRDLTQTEEAQLNKYAETIIVKGVKSPERLLDESALFLHRVEADLPEEKQQMLKLIHNKEAVLKGRKILLVDDDMRNVFALSSVLEERGINIVVARDGIECLEKLKEQDHFDAVLMDIMMPRMDGYEAMQEIRKNIQHKKLPIIALTAKAMKGDRSKCIEAGASDYLAKPVDADKLISMLRVWLY